MNANKNLRLGRKIFFLIAISLFLFLEIGFSVNSYFDPLGPYTATFSSQANPQVTFSTSVPYTLLLAFGVTAHSSNSCDFYIFSTSQVFSCIKFSTGQLSYVADLGQTGAVSNYIEVWSLGTDSGYIAEDAIGGVSSVPVIDATNGQSLTTPSSNTQTINIALNSADEQIVVMATCFGGTVCITGITDSLGNSYSHRFNDGGALATWTAFSSSSDPSGDTLTITTDFSNPSTGTWGVVVFGVTGSSNNNPFVTTTSTVTLTAFNTPSITDANWIVVTFILLIFWGGASTLLIEMKRTKNILFVSLFTLVIGSIAGVLAGFNGGGIVSFAIPVFYGIPLFLYFMRNRGNDSNA